MENDISKVRKTDFTKLELLLPNSTSSIPRARESVAQKHWRDEHLKTQKEGITSFRLQRAQHSKKATKKK